MLAFLYIRQLCVLAVYCDRRVLCDLEGLYRLALPQDDLSSVGSYHPDLACRRPGYRRLLGYLHAARLIYSIMDEVLDLGLLTRLQIRQLRLSTEYRDLRVLLELDLDYFTALFL